MAQKGTSLSKLIDNISPCSMMQAFNLLQDKWANGIIDIRSNNDFKIAHIEFSANIPIDTNNNNIDNINTEYVLKSISKSKRIKKQFPKSDLLFITKNGINNNNINPNDSIISPIINICKILENSDIYKCRKYPKILK